MDGDRVNSVGIFIGLESLYWVVLESQSDGKIEVKSIEKFPYISPLDFNNYLSQENRLKILRILEKTASLGILENRKVNLAIDSALTYIIKIPVDRNLHPQELKEHLVWEFSQHFVDDKYENYSISFHPVKVNPDGSFDSIILLIIQRVILNFFIHLFEDLQIKLKVTDVDHFASETICRAVYPEFESGNNFLISFKKNCFDLSLAQNGSIVSYRKVPFQTEDDVLNYFEKELVPVIKSMRNKIGKVFVWGEGLKQRFIKELDSCTPIEVMAINPFRFFIINKEVLNSPVYESLHEFTPACGIALRK
jgi:Tfp pilus assembly PilM family ATPase